MKFLVSSVLPLLLVFCTSITTVASTALDDDPNGQEVGDGFLKVGPIMIVACRLGVDASRFLETLRV
jgi:hypothetical protein